MKQKIRILVREECANRLEIVSCEIMAKEDNNLESLRGSGLPYFVNVKIVVM